jgi:hypothetical protein
MKSSPSQPPNNPLKQTSLNAYIVTGYIIEGQILFSGERS